MFTRGRLGGKTVSLGKLLAPGAFSCKQQSGGSLPAVHILFVIAGKSDGVLTLLIRNDRGVSASGSKVIGRISHQRGEFILGDRRI